MNFSPEPDFGGFPKATGVEPSPHDLYNKLGIDLSMTVPTSEHLSQKLNPEVPTPKLTLLQDLGLQLSDTKMNSCSKSAFPKSPKYQQNEIEQVKRNIISHEQSPKNLSIFDAAKLILDITEKVFGRNIKKYIFTKISVHLKISVKFSDKKFHKKNKNSHEKLKKRTKKNTKHSIWTFFRSSQNSPLG